MMTFRRSVLAALAVSIAIGFVPVQAATAASIDQAFAAAVARVLAGVHNNYLDGLSAAQKREFVACAQKVMNAAPTARKQYVLGASNSADQRKRFDEVSLDNRAELKKAVSSNCVQ
jgi:CelD/BcsL family acetyltransferase involved in cellulose biosynthesis